MSKKKSAALIILVILIVIAAIVAVDIFTDYLNLGISDISIGTIDWDKYFGGITTVVIFGTCFLIAVAIMAATFYHSS